MTGPPPGAHPLKIKARCIADADTRRGHMEYAIKMVERGLAQDFGGSPEHEAEIVIVSSGPSVKDELKAIKKLKERGALILAVKGAHKWLIKNKVTPHCALAVDPQAYIKTNFTNKRKSITYFLASQCHPELFDYLTGYKIVVLHLLMKSNRDLVKGKVEIPGGSTSGLRAIVLGHLMGFRKFHLFGYDSCLKPNKNLTVDKDGKVTGHSLRKITGEAHGQNEAEKILPLICNGRQFFADPAMASQANEFEAILQQLPGIRVKAYGDGLIQHIVETKAAKNEPGYCSVGDDFPAQGMGDIRKKVPPELLKKIDLGNQGFLRGAGYR